MTLFKAASSRGGLCLLLVLLYGCASAPQTRQLLVQPDAALPGQTELTQLPFHPQQRYQCGPAALATVLNWSDIDITPTTLISEVYLPTRQGSLQVELMASTRRHGRIAYPIDPDLKSLLQEVAAGNPVLILQNLGLSWAPTWHFAVVAGFDLEEQVIILRSGLNERRRTRLSTFERTWARGGYWGIVVLKPEQLPANVNPDKYLNEVVMLETVQRWQEAYSAYLTALKQWPGNLIAQIGLGNAAYQLGEKGAAANAFRSAVADHPESGIAHNNLAQVLLEQGNLQEARAHAEQAVKLGGPQVETFKTTLTEIKRQSIQ